MHCWIGSSGAAKPAPRWVMWDRGHAGWGSGVWLAWYVGDEGGRACGEWGLGMDDAGCITTLLRVCLADPKHSLQHALPPLALPVPAAPEEGPLLASVVSVVVVFQEAGHKAPLEALRRFRLRRSTKSLSE